MEKICVKYYNQVLWVDSANKIIRNEIILKLAWKLGKSPSFKNISYSKPQHKVL